MSVDTIKEEINIETGGISLEQTENHKPSEPIICQEERKENSEKVESEPRTAESGERVDRNGESARFEIKIQDIPRYVTTKQAKKYVARYGVVPKKVSVHTGHSYMSFITDAERLKAVESLHGVVWKGHTLKVRCSDKDAKEGGNKRKETDRSNGSISKKVCLQGPEETTDIVTKVTPLHQMSYEEQLSLKMKQTTDSLCNISRQMREANSDFPSGTRFSYFGELLPIVPCPVQSHYRNKCEFTVGLDTEGKPTVGFRMSRCKDGPSTVARPDGCTHLPEWTLRCVQHFQNFLSVVAAEDSDKSVYDVVKKTGFWRQLTVRCFTFDLLVIVTVHPQEFSKDDLDVVKKQLVELFFDGTIPSKSESISDKKSMDFRVTSLYFQLLRNTSDTPIYELLHGVPYVYENLISPFSGAMMRFRISPGAFFQTCSRACPVLFSNIGQMCDLSPDRTLLLDICCGTGTIGIFLASQVKRVIGIELCKEAVADAIENAKGNEVVEKCSYHCGRAEDVLLKLITTGSVTSDESQDVVAILDPPRAGLPDKIIMGIRRADFIKRLIYISCDVRGASKNLVDLCRKQSNKYLGENFSLKKSVPIDMFPQTTHCELVMMFER